MFNLAVKAGEETTLEIYTIYSKTLSMAQTIQHKLTDLVYNNQDKM
jgi:hypothetical protein